MTKKEKLRKLLEEASCDYKFSDCVSDVLKAVKASYFQMRTYYASNNKERAIVDTMYEIIGKVAKKEEIDFSVYSDEQLLEVLELTRRELNDGAYTYDFGVLWYGYSKYEEVLKLMTEPGKKGASAKDIFVEMLLNGSIIHRLKTDFPKIQLSSQDEYQGYIDTHWYKFTTNTFAKLGNYELQVVNIGSPKFKSMASQPVTYLILNKHLGFRLVNRKTAKILKTDSYSDVKKILRRA